MAVAVYAASLDLTSAAFLFVALEGFLPAAGLSLFALLEKRSRLGPPLSGALSWTVHILGNPDFIQGHGAAVPLVAR